MKIEDKFIIVDILGIGASGIVYKVIDRITGEKFALKRCNYDNQVLINPTVMREIDILFKIDHKHIIKLYEVIIGYYQNKKYVFLVLSLGDYSLYDFKKYKPNKYLARKRFLEILDAINYIDKLGYIHNDLTPNNIIVKKNSLMVIDFGLCRRKYRKYDYEIPPSLFVRPFELIFNGKNIEHNKIDIWALGRIFYFMITHNFNQNNENIKQISSSLLNTINTNDDSQININQFKLIRLNNELKSMPKEYKIINNMCQYNPFSRPTIENLLNNDVILEFKKEYNYKFNEDYPIFFEKELDNIKIIEFNEKNKYFLINLINIYSRLVKYNDLDEEIIYVSLYNFKKLIQYDISKNNYMLLGIIIFWISNKIISNKILVIDDIKAMVSVICEINISNSDIAEIHDYICIKLTWNLDPYTTYTFKNYIPQKFRDIYKFISLVIELYDPFKIFGSVPNELVKTLIINKLLEKQYKKYKKSMDNIFQYLIKKNICTEIQIIDNTNKLREILINIRENIGNNFGQFLRNYCVEMDYVDTLGLFLTMNY